MITSYRRAVCAASVYATGVLASCSGGGGGDDLSSELSTGADPTLTIVQNASVIAPRAQEALDLDPLGVFSGIPMDQRMNVGLRVELGLSAPGATTVTEVQWMVPGQVIASYEISSAVALEQGYLTNCATSDLTPTDLQQDTIAFYYTETGDSMVSVTATVDGTRMSSSKVFAVRRNPKAEIFYSTGPGSARTLTDLTADGNTDIDDFLLYQQTFGHDADPAGTSGFGIIGEHNAWHELVPTETDGDEFFRFHRGFIEKADCWRGIFGYPCVQVYATAPDSVPTSPEVDHFGIGAGSSCDLGTGSGDGNGIIALERDTFNYPMIEELPAELTIAGDGSVSLVDFATGHDLVLGIIDYHDRQHSNICHSGDFLHSCTAPADPIFWRFHLMLTKVYELWQFLKLDEGTMTIPPLECTGPDGARAFFPDPDLQIHVSCANPVVFDCNPPSGSVFPLGTTTVTCTVSDVMMLDAAFGGANPGTTQTVSFDVTVVDTTAPTITCPGDISVECEGPEGSTVTFETTATDICDELPEIVSTPPSGTTFPLGTTTVESVATDASGNTSTCTFEVTVVDTTAPTIIVDPNPTVLWPPHHGYVTLHIEDFVLEVLDLCDDTVGLDSVKIMQVTSDEQENAGGQGAGNTVNDIVISADCRAVDIRNERAGPGNGRVYTITVGVSDSSGNASSETYQVLVPHDQGMGGQAVDDGPAYTVTCGS